MLRTRGLIVVILLFLIATGPFAIAVLTPRTYSYTPFSIYNQSWEGASEFREIFEEAGINVETVISSTNALNRLNDTPPDIFVLLGPALHYDFSESLALLVYLLRGGRVLIADDFGTGNDILSLLSTVLSSISDTIDMNSLIGFDQVNWTQGLNAQGENETIDFPFPVGLRFNGSVLVDTGSYLDSPVQPILRANTGGFTYISPWARPLTVGVSQVLCNYATSISWKLRYYDFDERVYKEEWFPFGSLKVAVEGIIHSDFQLAALTSTESSWLESNVTQVQYGEYYPDSNEWGAVRFPVFAFIPLGTGARAGMLALCSDPSMFINGMLNNGNFDNHRFAENLVSMLFNGRPDASVIFDEAHLRHAVVSPLLTLGTYLRFMSLVTMFPLFAPFVPIIVILYGRRYLPKKTESKPILFAEQELYYGRSFFAAKMRQFLHTHDYNKAISLIYRRVQRQILRRTRYTKLTPELTAKYLVSLFGDTLGNQEFLEKQFTIIMRIPNSKTKISEQKFITHYLFLKRIADALVGIRVK
ncbi:MAG: DUF4350 domain-containing protein [Candidatus Hodarchaeota archaeon]